MIETLGCPLCVAAPAPALDVMTAAVLADRCPLSGASLEPQDRVVGLRDGQPASDTGGRCPEPCGAVWWVQPDAASGVQVACYAGREIRVDWIETEP